MKKVFLSIFIILAGLCLTSCKERYVASVTELQLANISPSSGYSGGIVTVYGRNFSNNFGENKVFVGEHEAKVLEYSAWDLTIVLPELELGSYPVKVVTPEGEVSGLSFTYIERPEHEYIVSTIAGSGKAVTADGKGMEASFQSPEGVVMDAYGNLWVSQRGGSSWSIRKIDRSFNVTTIAKTELPWHGSFAPDGKYWFAAKAVNKIFNMTTEGAVTEVPLSGCTINNPMDVRFDKEGNMWICSRNPVSQVIKVVNGTVAKTYDQIPWPSCITFDEQGRAIVGTEVNTSSAEGAKNGLYMIDGDEVTMIAGVGVLSTADNSINDGEKGDPLSAVVGHVGGVFAAKDGSVYFGDKTNKAVRKITPDAEGDYTKGTIKTLVTGHYPSDLWVTDDCMRIYLTCATAHQVRLIEVL